MTNVVQPLLSHDKALGVENGSISDKQITASSEKNASQAAIHGRLNFEALSGKVGSWTARENDVYQWLQIDLGNHDTEVTKIATQGGNSIDNWVTKYKLQYSDDGVTFKYYRKERCCKGKVFAGNEDTNSVVEHRLTPPVKSRYIRFQPLHWHNGISMRVELYGCEVPKPREKEFEDKLMDTIDDGNFEVIKQSLTPVALGKCESNPLQMGMKVNFKLRELAEKMGPDKERFQELANSVEEFTSCFLDPLRCDKQWLMTFGDLVLDDQLNVAIENGQKKFFTHPVVHEEMKRKWDGRHFSRRKWKWWQKLLFHVWCVFDLMLFSIILYPLSYWKNIKEEQRRDEPKIEKAPESQKVCVGYSVEFKCEVSGKPNLDMTWYKEGEELKNTENKLEITTTRVLVGNQRKHIEEKECTLKIINAQIEDQGEYTFTLKNDSTDPSKSATFTVEVKEETKNGKLDEAWENKVDDGEFTELSVHSN